MSPNTNRIEEIDQAIDRAEQHIRRLRQHVLKLEIAPLESKGAQRVLTRSELDLKRIILHRAVLATNPALGKVIQPELLKSRLFP
jgi:hypothetical protein